MGLPPRGACATMTALHPAVIKSSASDFQPPRKPSPAEAQELRWHELLQRLQTLNAQLEYLKLMMKLGVR